jgi:hypothetical protein
MTVREYNRSVEEYADLNLELPEYAELLSKAAVALDQQRLLMEIISPRLKATGKEKVHIRFDEEEGCQIIANPQGCLYLTRAFRALSMSPAPGAHLHLDYGVAPMVGETYPAVLYMEDDDYFIQELEIENVEPQPLPMKTVDPSQIKGFFVTEDYPEHLKCTRNKIYTVLDWEWMGDNRLVYRKEIRDDFSRMVTFTFKRDDGETMQIGLDLDDEDVGFITQDDIKTMLWKA